MDSCFTARGGHTVSVSCVSPARVAGVHQTDSKRSEALDKCLGALSSPPPGSESEARPDNRDARAPRFVESFRFTIIGYIR